MSAPEWVARADNQSRLAFGLALTELARRDDRVASPPEYEIPP